MPHMSNHQSFSIVLVPHAVSNSPPALWIVSDLKRRHSSFKDCTHDHCAQIGRKLIIWEGPRQVPKHLMTHRLIITPAARPCPLAGRQETSLSRVRAVSFPRN